MPAYWEVFAVFFFFAQFWLFLALEFSVLCQTECDGILARTKVIFGILGMSNYAWFRPLKLHGVQQNFAGHIFGCSTIKRVMPAGSRGVLPFLFPTGTKKTNPHSFSNARQSAFAFDDFLHVRFCRLAFVVLGKDESTSSTYYRR